MAKCFFVLLLLLANLVPIFAKTVASQKISNLMNLETSITDSSASPLSDQISTVKNDENSKGLSSSVGTDRTDEFVDHVAKMIKIVEGGGKFNATVTVSNGRTSIQNNGDENISKLLSLLSNDKTTELNIYTVLKVRLPLKDSKNTEIEKVFNIINSYTTKIMKFDIMGIIERAGISNKSISTYFIDMTLCIKNGEKIGSNILDRKFQKISPIDFAFETPSDIDKVVYYTGNIDAGLVEDFKQIVNKNAGKNNKKEIINKLDLLLTAIKESSANNR